MDEDIDGNKSLKYPQGRVITCLPELGIILSDKKNPYKDGKFPFVLMKNYDVPFKFWGVGEVEQILSPQIYVNELTNQIIDNAKNTANMQWIIDKNAGIGQGKLTNRPGLVIRKNPGAEVRRDTPPPMPTYVREQIDVLKADIQDISGVLDSLKGEKQTGVVAASAILALQEASQSRIRLKIKIMESNLTELANMVYSRMQQFWKLDRWVRVTDIEGNPSFKEIGQQVLANDYDLKVMAGSTMPVNKNAMMDLMIRLAQTNGEDGLPIVDRKAVLEYLPIGDKKAISDRFAELKAQQEQQQQMQLQQQEQMQQQQLAQQQAGMQQQDREQVGQLGQIVQQLMNAMKTNSQQVDELLKDKQDREKQEYERQIEEKGYKRGVKDGKMQNKEEEKEIDEVLTDNAPMDDVNDVESQPSEEEIQMMNALDNQQIPDEALEELLMLAQQDPDTFREIVEAYPELAQMLQQDIQTMNGGLMSE